METVGLYESLRAQSLEGELLENINLDFKRALFLNSKYEAIFAAIRTANLYFHYLESVICIKTSGRHWIIVGDILFTKKLLIKEQSILREGAFSALYHLALQKKKTLCGYYLSQPLDNHMYRSIECGSSSLLHLKDFSPQGSGSREHRRAINSGKRVGLSYKEIHHLEREQYLPKLKEKFKEFIEDKNKPIIKYLLSDIDFVDVKETVQRWFVVEYKGEIAAFVIGNNYGVGQELSFYCDFMVQVPSGHKLALDYLLVQIALDLKCEGYHYLSFGLNALSPINTEDLYEKLLKFLSRFEFWYSFRGVRRFKAKYANRIVSSYLIVDKRANIFSQFMKLAQISFIR